ncbi:rab-GTPase-TBC domain-containing protein [Phascolomyces articulosus]|uniref:Rab-GTPase-TBC domain-containing protein n=1 Tax=Phascolomyces articulosus TaxID=60185 RepID=A0AAD5KKA9_9FUNG|nr:rab-GTPase-TBC domain-containing protein [Phascolomyces articulosus]
MLPPKDPHEEKKHLQQHQAMMKKARQLEAKKEREHHKRREERDKKMSQSLQIWEDEILTNWKIRVKDRRTHELWLQGVPPRCRKRVWMLAIGNNLKLSKESFKNDVQHRTNGSNNGDSTKQRYNNNGNIPDDRDKRHEPEWIRQSIEENDELYNLRRVRRTSSLNVLQEDPSERTHYPESIDEHEPPVLREGNYEGEMEHVNDDEDVYHAENLSSNDLHSRRGMDLQEMYENQKQEQRQSSEGKYSGESSSHASGEVAGMDEDDDVRLGDDIGSGDEDDGDGSDLNKIPIDDSETSHYLKKTIEEDILRTLPSLCVFQPDGPLFSSLKKVLQGYAHLREEDTYSRGTSFLAGMLLLNMSTDEALVALPNLIRKSGVLSALYDGDEQRVRGYFKIFNIGFAENLPKLYLHFKNLSLTPDHYLPDWFMTIFSSIVPLELSSWLWDIFLLEGDIILFKTGLAVLKYLEPLLWGGNFGETARILNMGFIGEERGEEVKAALAVSGHITEGDEEHFFNEVLGRNGIQFDRLKFRELLAVHVLTK